MPVSIYGLMDPRSGTVCYVGKTVQPLTLRLQQHVWAARTEHTTYPSSKWIKSLIDAGVRPEIVLLEEVAPERWRQAEREWGQRYHLRSPLVNQLGRLGAGSTRSYVSRWTSELEARLGKDADAVIAEEMGIDRKSVSYRRHVLGIPAGVNRARSRPPPAMGGHNRKELPAAVLARLGSVPDHILATEAGVSKKLIGRLRRARDIPSYAAQTGASGRFRTGNYPARWTRRASAQR